ncbi:MAG TPA: FAD-binding oxidoreductase [Dongiaceae bacterium]|nr:FAD-binding oxidoreductase [Dongiaceae bacterium]
MVSKENWGNRPWRVDFRPQPHQQLPVVDFAVIGAGFSGLAAATRLKILSPAESVVVLEAESIGAGASGHTGGVALAETAAGDLPGLGDVLSGYQEFIGELKLNTDLHLPGCYELARTNPLPDPPFCWDDSGPLCATKEVPGGTIDPGKTVSELARAAEQSGVWILENSVVTSANFDNPTQIELRTPVGSLVARRVLFATNAFALELTGIPGHPAFTTAVLTEVLPDDILGHIGVADRKPFYTVDLPYLWGRLYGNAIMFGSGLLFFEDWRDLCTLDIEAGDAPEVFQRLEDRVHKLHPALANVKFTHRWGGPICISDDWKPVFCRHPRSENALVLGAFSGHGVAQSVYLGIWAADVLLDRRALPDWK